MSKAKTIVPVDTQHATADFPSGNLFKMGEVVCLKKTGVMYHVVGISLYLGYDFCLWIYNLAKPYHNETVIGDGPWKYGRMDINMVKDAKEIELMSAAEAYAAQRAELQTKIDGMTSELAKLQQQAKQLPE